MNLLADLGWLRRAPADLRERCRAIAGNPNSPDIASDTALIDVANYALDINQLTRVGKLVAERLKSPIDTVLARFKLALIGSGTTSLIAPAIGGSSPRHSILIEVVEGEYGRALEEALNPTSTIRHAQPDGVVLALDYRDLRLDTAVADGDAAAARVEAAFSHIATIAENLRPSLKGPLLLQTVVPPLEPLFGSLDAVESGSTRSMVAALNMRLAGWIAQGNDVLVDAAALANAVGL
jgi:predicted enzyme involved in methoxymalonyl-ACP biosynthesis